MHLKRLEIKGFKSFADHTEIHFGQGINVVVGPNGCGKSNVVDAVRWVLGENNVRNLRGQKGEDIIFSGTDNKRAHGMASVEMIVDNSDHFLPLEYEEVNLTRKGFRSGESEFYVNRSRVRMKDVYELFMGTGLGKKGYTIISQGELEELLNAQPLERRLILEEASGIIKYRQQREEVNRRLESTGHDLIRLNDMLLDLNQRREELTDKANKARTYLQVSQETQGLEQTVLAFDLQRIQRDIISRQKELDVRLEALQELEVHRRDAQQRVDELEQNLDQLRLENQARRENQYDLETEISAIKAEIQLSQEKIRNHRERAVAAGTDADKYRRLMEKLEQDMDFNRNDYENQQAFCHELEEQCLQAEAHGQQMEDEIAAALKQFEAQKGVLFECAQEESRIKNTIQEYQERAQKSNEKRVRLEIQLEQIKKRLMDLNEQRSTLQQENAGLGVEIESLTAQHQVADAKRAACAAQLKDLDDQVQKVEQQSLNHTNRLSNLKGMRENLTGYSTGAKAVLRWAQSGQQQGIIGVIGELIEVPTGLEVAVETATGRGLENVVVESAAAAQSAINRLKQNRAGRVTFLPLDNLRIRDIPKGVFNQVNQLDGVVGIASQLVRYRPEHKKAVEYLLGRVLIVDDLVTGVRLFKHINYSFTIVTREGELINASGAMTGGVHADRGPSLLQRRAEERAIEEALAGCKTGLLELNQHREEIRQTVQASDRLLANLEKEIVQLKLRIEMTVRQMQTCADEATGLRKDCDVVITDIERQDKEVLTAEQAGAQLQSQCQDIQGQLKESAARLEAHKDAMARLRQESEVHRERRHSYREQLEMKRRELDNTFKNLEQFQQVEQSYQQSWQEAVNLEQRLHSEIELENGKIQSLQTKLAGHTGSLSVANEELEALLKRETESRDEYQTIKQSLQPIQEQVMRAEQGIRAGEVGLARVEADLSNLNGIWQELYGDTSPLSITQEGLTLARVKDMKERIRSLKEQAEELGPIDVGAIQESEDIETRWLFINQQVQDLVGARDALQTLLKDTEKLMSKDFAHFLMLANHSFQQTCAEMFNGGEAALIMDTDRSGLDAGVDIQIKPPGKKLQSLHLLSGGERALTCIAFLFALLRLKPVPFCVLDEIDSALDETNLLRFTRFLKGMSEETQFIVITHRQTTIEAGETIYGITMAEKGISGVFTLNLEDAAVRAG